MCGFLISVTKKNINPSIWDKAFQSIRHRGPDNSRIKVINNKSLKIKFGFHRLAIVDHKNSDADQPFETKKSILVFNGEIYNYLSLKQKLSLKKIKFKTNSDTEVLIRYLEIFGLSKTLKDLDGMWSFAWFSKKDNKMIVARDRYGEKPLYFYKDKDLFVISSEIKAILLLNKKKFNIDKVTANNFLYLGIVNYNNKTLFSKIFQVPPSYFGIWNMNIKHNLKLFCYYNFKEKPNNQSIERNSIILKEKLTKSLVSRLSKEVKVGFLISGGIDSSINYSIAKKIVKKNKLNLFYAASLDKNSKDNKHILYLENFYKLKINRVYLPKNNKILFKYLNKLTWINDYPIGSVGSINQYLIGVAAKKIKIKILISGQGADELFFGYLKYYSFYLINLIKDKNIIKFFVNFIYLIKSDFFTQIKSYSVFKYLKLNFFDKSNFLNKNLINIPNNFKNFKNLNKRSFDDMNKFSVPTLCHTEDRMYMASGIETRFPYLNLDLQKFSLSLPDTFKLSFGFTKYILRKAFVEELPKKILFRKDKEGFETGVNSLLKGNKEFLRNKIINKDSLIIKQDIISIKFLKYFDDYLNSFEIKKDYDPNFLFRVVSFEIWLNIFKKHLNFDRK